MIGYIKFVVSMIYDLYILIEILIKILLLRNKAIIDKLSFNP